MPLKLPRFGGPGSTADRRKFWDSVQAAVLSCRKLHGRLVTVDEYQAFGSIINATHRQSQSGTGACCIAGECSILSEADCEAGDGTFQGVGTVCDGIDCTQGACCDASGNCTLGTEEDCVSSGGTFQGYGSDCDPNPCPPPGETGACCVDGICSITTEAGCAGVYMGNGTTCDPDPCSEACCGVAFNGFEGGGQYLVQEDHIIRNAHTPGCDLTADFVTTTTLSSDGIECSPTPIVTCEGFAQYQSNGGATHSNCSWESDGAGGCHWVLQDGTESCYPDCASVCLDDSCTPVPNSDTEASCTCDFDNGSSSAHLEHTITLSHGILCP